MTTQAFGSTQQPVFAQSTSTFNHQQNAEGGMSTKVIQQQILNTMRDVSKNLAELKECILPHKNQAVHVGIQCESCKCVNLIGIRYKCFICENFNLCEKCEAYCQQIHAPDHCFIKLRAPETMQQIIANGLPCSLVEFQTRLTSTQ
jgi:hypothetical protein